MSVAEEIIGSPHFPNDERMAQRGAVRRQGHITCMDQGTPSSNAQALSTITNYPPESLHKDHKDGNADHRRAHPWTDVFLVSPQCHSCSMA